MGLWRVAVGLGLLGLHLHAHAHAHRCSPAPPPLSLFIEKSRQSPHPTMHERSDGENVRRKKGGEGGLRIVGG